MPTRIPAPERTTQKLDELLSQGVAYGEARAELLKLAVRKIVEEALEAEVAEAVSRGSYEGGAAPGAGYPNGHRRGRLRSAEGDRTRDTNGSGRSATWGTPYSIAGLAGRTAELEPLAVEMYGRGLSTRDVEAALQDAIGASLLNRTAVSQVTERLWQEYEAFTARDLSEFAVASFFVDGVTASCTAFFEDHSAGACRIRCSPSPTGRRGSSGPWRRAVRRRCGSAAWSIGCATSGARRRRVSGPRSPSGPAPVTRWPRPRGPR